MLLGSLTEETIREYEEKAKKRKKLIRRISKEYPITDANRLFTTIEKPLEIFWGFQASSIQLRGK